ncbi:MAG: hypothetical protein K8R59_17425 [Thermoanaerobaculales bacterium]|nr:hypothetical protein [Thermoanaerobaculales bacterium]
MPPKKSLAEQLTEFEEAAEETQTGVTPASSEPTVEATEEPPPAAEPEAPDTTTEVAPDAPEDAPEAPPTEKADEPAEPAPDLPPVVEWEGKQYTEQELLEAGLLPKILEDARTWGAQNKHFQKLYEGKLKEDALRAETPVPPEPDSPGPTPEQHKERNAQIVAAMKPHIKAAVASGVISSNLAGDYQEDAALMLFDRFQAQEIKKGVIADLAEIRDQLGISTAKTTAEANKSTVFDALDGVVKDYGEAYSGLSDDGHRVEFLTWVSQQDWAEGMSAQAIRPSIMRGLYDDFVAATGVEPPAHVAEAVIPTAAEVRAASLAGGGGGGGGGATPRKKAKNEFEAFIENVQDSEFMR